MGTQEGVGASFKRQIGRQGDTIFLTQLNNLGKTLGDVLVVGLHGLSELEVAQCVLVSAVDQSTVRQGGQSAERCMHLLRRTFEQPAAACCKQGIAAEQQRLGGVIVVEGYVAEGMSRNCVNGEIQPQHCDDVMVDKRNVARRDGFRLRPQHSGVRHLLDLRDTAYVIVVMMRDQDIGELMIRVIVQPGQHRGCVSRIDHGAAFGRKVL